ncbi:MAG: hypothetical protein KAR20_08190, partial [Candidatus Heimdallarchaeota archaeon]|nr:hypothetical protein [Candidatus Heimdallarchaeota archaeon]
ESWCVIKWHGQITKFKREEIARIDGGNKTNSEDGMIVPETAAEEEWVYENDIVIKLTNGEVLDSLVSSVAEDTIILRKIFEDGGFVEQDIEREKVEYFIFKPLRNDESKQIRATMREYFPGMRFCEAGNITLITDSYITSVKRYKQILLQAQTNVYCKFFNLFKGREQTVQNFVVVFDSYEKFVEYAAADGVPGWLVLGYFSPTKKVLHLYNMIGDQIQVYVKSIFEGFDNHVDGIKDCVDERHHRTIDGQAKGYRDKYAAYYDWWINGLRKTTFSTLRHEFGHEMFSNWGLQMVIASKMVESRTNEEIEKKKKYLEAATVEEKKKRLMDLVNMHSDEEFPEIDAANSWLAEGTATYCELDQLGGENERWIFEFQEMMRDDMFLP